MCNVLLSRDLWSASGACWTTCIPPQYSKRVVIRFYQVYRAVPIVPFRLVSEAVEFILACRLASPEQIVAKLPNLTDYKFFDYFTVDKSRFVIERFCIAGVV